MELSTIPFACGCCSAISDPSELVVAGFSISKVMYVSNDLQPSPQDREEELSLDPRMNKPIQSDKKRTGKVRKSG